MKLNYRRIVLVGMAFFLITAFWQAYDAIIPLILTNHFGLSQTVSGAVMSLDNVLAVFLLPIFGSISDRVDTKLGKRTPFIIVGTIVASISFFLLTFIDNFQLAKLLTAGNEVAGGDLAVLALEITEQNPLVFVGFMATLLVTLVAMATFRSPAVALMPDITPKPLRSKANAIINLMGAVGGILVLVLGIVFSTSKNQYMEYTPYVTAVIILMLTGFLIFVLCVKEKAWSGDVTESPTENENVFAVSQDTKLTRGELKSFILILLSVALWYVGYNSITSKYSVYATGVLGFDFNLTLIIAQAAAIVSYIPVGVIASKVGRKKTVLAGVAMLCLAFFFGIFVTSDTSEIIMYPIFILAGIGWATINVNSFPMAVELARHGNVGKFTGYYYTASMTAQILAPILSGMLYDVFGMKYTFFTFGTVFVALSFVSMLFVKHGDSKPQKRSSLIEHLDVED